MTHLHGWIKLHRQILGHWLYLENRIFSRYEAWLDLVLLASYENKKVVMGGETINIERGMLITSELNLMRRWKWSKSKVRNFLGILEKEQMIERKTNRKWTVIKVKNYELYQGSDEGKTDPKKRANYSRKKKSSQGNSAKNERKEKSMIDRMAAAQEWIEQGGDPYEFKPD